jgi:hypothetical protein
MGKLGEKLIPIACFAYLAVGLAQLFAVVDGLSIGLGWSGYTGFICAVLVNWAPFWGTIAGVYGAHFGWGWEWIWAALFFGWPSLLFLTAGAMELIAEAVPNNYANGNSAN